MIAGNQGAIKPPNAEVCKYFLFCNSANSGKDLKSEFTLE